MSEWHRENPELAEQIAALPPSQQLAAERSLIPDPRAIADEQRKREREEGQ